MKNDLGDALKYFALLLLLLLIFVPTYSLSQDRGDGRDDGKSEGDGRDPESGGGGSSGGGSSGGESGDGSSGGGGGRTRTTRSQENILTRFWEDLFNIPKDFVKRPQRRVEVDPDAKHSCEVDKFYVNLSRNSRTFNSVQLDQESNSNASYTLEIIDQPVGSYMFFSRNGGQKISGSWDSLDFEIRKIGSLAKGKHQIVLVYTANYDIRESSVTTCEFNIINN